MITYKIDGVPATFKSKPVNLERDINRILAQEGLPKYTQVTIIQDDDISQPATDSASDSNPGELETLPESAAAPKRSNKRKPEPEASDLQPVSDRVDKFDLSDDESITDFNDYPFSAE